MKFLILTNHSYMLWQFRRDLIAALQQRGEVVLSMPFVGHEKEFEAAGCRCIETDVDRRGINPFRDVKLLQNYKRLLLEEHPDMVITYSIKPNIYGAWLCGKLGIPCCVNVQGLGTAFQKKGIAAVVTQMYRAALKTAKVVFFENENNARTFVARGILPAGEPVVLHGAGVDTKRYPCQPYPDEASGIRFLYLGRIMREKGVEEFFSSAKVLKQRYGDRVHFDLVGFFEGSHKDAVKDLDDRGILHFYGFQADPRPYYTAAHCVVLPSYHEGMSNVLLEAAATGRPLIASDIPGCREAVDNGVSGFLCKPMDTDSLIDCMERFLALDEQARREMGLRGRSKVEAEFEKGSVVAQTLEEILK